MRDNAERGRSLRAVVPNTPVVAATGMTGRVTEILSEFPDDEGAIRVAWDNGGTTLVPFRSAMVDDSGVRVAPDAGMDMTTTTDTEVATGRTTTVLERVGDEGDALTIPLIEEEIAVGTREREAGRVVFHLRTEETPQTFTEDVEREELLVEESPVNRVLAEGEQIAVRREGDVTIIPIIEEKVVTIIQRVLAKEVRISKRIVTTSQTVQATTRRTYVEADPGTLGSRVHAATDAAPLAGTESRTDDPTAR